MSGHFFGNQFEINKLFVLHTMHKSNQHDVGSENYFRIRLVLSKVTGVGQTQKKSQTEQVLTYRIAQTK